MKTEHAFRAKWTHSLIANRRKNSSCASARCLAFPSRRTRRAMFLKTSPPNSMRIFGRKSNGCERTIFRYVRATRLLGLIVLDRPLPGMLLAEFQTVDADTLSEALEQFSSYLRRRRAHADYSS